jgi:hypothetical protein
VRVNSPNTSIEPYSEGFNKLNQSALRHVGISGLTKLIAVSDARVILELIN